MGIKIISSCGACDASATTAPPVRGNPDPSRFEVLFTATYGEWVVAGVRYPDATNYEGNKVLVFRGVEAATIRGAKQLDPHFCKGSHLSPFARFEPTPEGIEAAKRFCEVMRGR